MILQKLKRMVTRKSLWLCTLTLGLTLVGTWAVNLSHGGSGKAKPESGIGIMKRDSQANHLFSERKRKLKGLVRNNHPGLFAEYHSDIRTRHGAPGPSYPPNYRIKALLKAHQLSSTKDLLRSTLSKQSPLNWVERGPGNVSGRTRGLLIDPDDPSHNTWYAGSVGGGVWKTENAGQTWSELTRGLPNLATSTLAMAASNTDVIYVGTGEGFFNVDQINGSGIWKTEDRGVTWEQLESTADSFEFQNVTRLIVDPQDDHTLLASTVPGIYHAPGQAPSSGIFRSEDGGQSWAKVYDAGVGRVEQILINPKNFRTQFATVRGVGVLKSLDGGQTWHDASAGLTAAQRMEMTVSPVDTSRLYLSAEGGSGGSTLFVSENGASSWLPAQSVGGPKVDWLADQGWYDNTIAAHPFDADMLFVGGINLWQMEIVPGLDSSEAVPTGVDLENTSSFLAFVDFGGELAGGGIAIGTAGINEFATVEVRFGAGKKQMAHRFTVPPGATSGVPDSDYTYRDYVEVPFEFWDLDNNRQLMVSFRDQNDNGQWELRKLDSNTAREYLFLHSTLYSNSPSGDIAQPAGQTSRQLYFLWPVLSETGSWHPESLPEATLRINFGRVVSKRVEVSNVTDGYRQFGGSPKGVHVDHHNILLIPKNEVEQSFRLLNANDGGVAFSDNGGETFLQPLNGYNTTQFYGVDKKNGAYQYIGGMQDNSTWISPGGGSPDAASNWFLVLGGDGFECVWNYADSRKLLASAQFNNIFRSLNEGLSWGNANTANGLTDVGGRAPFFTKLAKSKQDPDLIFAVGSSGVWRSDNFADSWDLVPMPEAWAGNRSFTEVKISLANPQIVWAAEAMQEDVRPFVSTDGGLSFSETSLYMESSVGSISGLETHPTDERTAYALFSLAQGPKILRTTDLGQNWEDISGFGSGQSSSRGFPDVAVYSLLVMPFDTDEIWAGTEIGLFESTDGGASWALADNGLPATAVFEMLIVNDEIVVATHGRGVWTVSLPELAGYEPNAATLSPRLNHAEAAGAGAIRVDASLRSAYDSTRVLVDGVTRWGISENAAPTEVNLDVPLSGGGSDTVSVMIVSFKGGNAFKSFAKQAAVFPLEQAQASYVTDFNTGADDFELIGLDLQPSDGFIDPAIHSDHPYPNSSTLMMTLKIPIVVASSAATLSYDDVALVQAGETGSRFGDQSFRDFVVVEGSDDFGLSWQSLADGYDARYDQAWLDTYTNDGVGSSSLFRSHTVNLRDTFDAGEQILIRFRLFADANVSGWGWVIDNLDIQGAVTSVSGEASLPENFSLSQNFPNPFNPTTDIAYSLPKSAHVTLRIFNVLGREIRTLTREQKNAGVYRVRWDGKDDSGRFLANGVYFYRIEAGGYVASRKMTLIK